MDEDLERVERSPYAQRITSNVGLQVEKLLSERLDAHTVRLTQIMADLLIQSTK